jgi:1,4-dihydroxy-2-naphthoyl-CoA hydrolase
MWLRKSSIEALNNRPSNHLAAHLGFVFTELTENSLSASMPVDDRTRQPVGILHGGASVVLAETLGSIASSLMLEGEQWMAVGLEINANHLRPVPKGFVTGICRPIHIGKKTHVWDIQIHNEEGKITCISRLTTAIVPRR